MMRLPLAVDAPAMSKIHSAGTAKPEIELDERVAERRLAGLLAVAVRS
jgi:hypothetical protein